MAERDYSVFFGGGGDSLDIGTVTPDVKSEDLKPKKRKGFGRLLHNVTNAPVVKQALYTLGRPQQVAFATGRRLAEIKPGAEQEVIEVDDYGNEVRRYKRGRGTVNPLTFAREAARGVGEGLTGSAERIDPSTGRMARGDLSLFQAVQGRDVVPTGLGKNIAVNLALHAGTDPLSFVAPGASAGKLAKAARPIEKALGREAAEQFVQRGGQVVRDLTPANRAKLAKAIKDTAKAGTSEAKAAKIAERSIARLERISPQAQLMVPGAKTLSRGRVLGKSTGAEAEALARPVSSAIREGTAAARTSPKYRAVAGVGQAARERLSDFFVTRSQARRELGEEVASELGAAGRSAASRRQSAGIDFAERVRTAAKGLTGRVGGRLSREDEAIVTDALNRSQGFPEAVQLPAEQARLQPLLDQLHGEAVRSLEGIPGRVTVPDIPGTAPANVPPEEALDSAIQLSMPRLDRPGAPGMSGPEVIAGKPGFVFRDEAGRALGRITVDDAGPNVEVLPEARRTGIGTQLTQKAIDEGLTSPEALQATEQTGQGAAFVRRFTERPPVQGPAQPGVGEATRAIRGLTGEAPTAEQGFLDFKGRQVDVTPNDLEQVRQLVAEAADLSPAEVKALLAEHPLSRLGVRTRSDLEQLARRTERALGAATEESQTAARIAARLRATQSNVPPAMSRAPADLQRQFAEAAGLPFEGAPAGRQAIPGGTVTAQQLPVGAQGPRVEVLSEAGQAAAARNPEAFARLLGTTPEEALERANRRVLFLDQGPLAEAGATGAEAELAQALQTPSGRIGSLIQQLRGRTPTITESDPLERTRALFEAGQNRQALRQTVEDFGNAHPDLVRVLERGADAPEGFDVHKVEGLGTVAVHPSLTPEVKRLQGWTFAPVEMRGFARGQGRLTRAYRAGALRYPGFTVKQTVGNVAAAAAKGVGPVAWARAGKLQRAAEKAYKLVAEEQQAGRAIDFDEAILRTAPEDIAREVISARANFGFSPGFFYEGQRLGGGVRGPFAQIQRAGAYMEDQARLATWLKAFYETGDPKIAGDFVADVLFDYGDLAPGVRYAKTVVNPFFTFTAKNLGYQLRLLRENPAALAAQLHGREAFNEAAPRRLRAQEEQGKVFVPGLNRYLNPNLPVQDLERLLEIPGSAAQAVAGKPGASQEAAQAAIGLLGGPGPGAIKALAEEATGRSTFTGADLPPSGEGGIGPFSSRQIGLAQNVQPGVSHALQLFGVATGRMPTRPGEGTPSEVRTSQALRLLVGTADAPAGGRKVERAERSRAGRESWVNQRVNEAYDEQDRLRQQRERELDRLGLDELPADREQEYKDAIAYQAALIEELKGLPGFVQVKFRKPKQGNVTLASATAGRRGDYSAFF